MKKLLLALLFQLAIAWPTIAISEEQSHNIDPSFTMSTPKGWELISKASMTSFNGMEQRTGSQYYDYGLKRKKSKSDFEYPYVVIQINKNGKVSEREFNKLERASLLGALATKRPNWLIKNHFYFDQSYNAVFYINNIKENNGQILEVIATSVLTKNGYILVNCYSKKNEIAKYITSFKNIITSVKPAFPYDYGVIMAPPRPSHSEVYVDNRRGRISNDTGNGYFVSALNKGVPAAIFGGICVVVFLFIRKLMRKLNNKKPE